MKTIFLALVRLYRLLLSPLLGPACRFEPSCSVYAEQAIRQRGIVTGGWLVIRRLGRCHPFGGHGFDPLPAPKTPEETSAASVPPALSMPGRNRN